MRDLELGPTSGSILVSFNLHSADQSGDSIYFDLMPFRFLSIFERNYGHFVKNRGKNILIAFEMQTNSV